MLITEPRNARKTLNFLLIKNSFRVFVIKNVILLILLLPAILFADEPSIIIRVKRMLDVKSGKIINDAVVLVKGDRIVEVQPSKISPSSTSINLGDVTLLPGLIDMHTHLTYDSVDFRLDLGKQPGMATAGRALLGAKFARIILMAGFTTVRDLGACCFSDITLMRAIEKGITDGPDVYPSGHIISITGGGCDQSVVNPDVRNPGPQEGIADSPDGIVQAVRYQRKYGAKVIKTCADENKFNEEELRLMADTAHRLKLKLAVHVWDTESIRAAVAAGADSIQHVSLMNDEIIDAMVKKGTYLVPTMHTINTFDFEKMPPEVRKKIEAEIPIYEKSLRDSIHKGVKIAFGSDTGQIPHGDNAKEFASLVKYGMNPLQAIQSATISAADLLGVKDRGSIEPGLRADLIAVSGNPLEDVRTLERVIFVMKTGKVYKQP
ncbi:amidohydrolase family protein [bacterium]|nr:amidohydrolase family protein [bacterium]